MKKITILIITYIACFAGHAQNITTIAGNGTLTYAGDNTPATATGLPGGVMWSAIDKHGNVYFPSGSWVRRMDTKGIITTIAGTGTVGFSGDGGPATAAELNNAVSVAIDTAGNVYIVDNERIRKVDVAGIITTYAGIAGGGDSGDGGPATAAGISPLNILADKSGNLYVGSGYRIRRIAPSGIITAFAGRPHDNTYLGDGLPATATGLGDVSQMAINSKGDLYCAVDLARIYKISVAGIISTVLDPVSMGDGGDGGPATAAAFNGLNGICFDGEDNMYLSCTNGGRIRRVDAVTGIVTTYAGTTQGYSGDGGPATAAQLQYGIKGISMDCADNLYIPDQYFTTARMRKVTRVHTPGYVNGSNTVSVCMNSTANPVDTILEATSAGIGESLDWTVADAPPHGSISGAPYTTTVGTTTMVPGLTYTPATGYSGADSFTVMVGPCEQVSDIRTIYVTVLPQPAVAAITGLDTICLGSVVTMSTTTSGGTWGSTVMAVAAIHGDTVTGKTAGTAIISYTVAGSNGCINAATHTIKVKDCPAGVPPVNIEAGITVYPNPVMNSINIQGVQSEQHYRIMNMVGAQLLSGELHSGVNSVSVGDIASGVYLLEVTDPLTGLRITNKIVKDQ